MTCAHEEMTCAIEVETLIKVPSVEFDRRLVDLIENGAGALSLPSLRLTSGATHDARFMATLYPSAMIFVPCRNGVSHNESEWADSNHLWAGAIVLAATIQNLCLEDEGGASVLPASEKSKTQRASHDRPS